MAIGEAIREALAGDATLAALLTGGIYRYEQTDRNGISRVTTPDAYDTGGFLKPCAIVRAGEARATAALHDSQAGTRQAVGVYLYDDSAYSTISPARDQVVALLDRQWIDGAGYVRRVGGSDDLRDPKLNNTALVRVDFEILG